MSVEEMFQTMLRLREPVAGPEWQIWEHKTFNIHRGVLRWRPQDPLTFGKMSQAVLEQVKTSFRVSWWRGFGFGVLIEVPALPEDLAAIDATIGTRANSKGTWQWTVLACPTLETAVGVHTWAEGYLAPLYRALIGHFESLRFEVGSFKKDKGALLQFLTGVARLKGLKIAEFEP